MAKQPRLGRRGDRTICLPIAKKPTGRFVNDPVEFRRTIDDCFRETPELFPPTSPRDTSSKTAHLGPARAADPPPPHQDQTLQRRPRSSCPT